MDDQRKEPTPLTDWEGQSLLPGSVNDVTLAISESYSSMNVEIPIRICRAEESGPTVFVTAALHGDEINGTGAVRALIQDPEFRLQRGALVLIPVLNLLAFDRHSRYLPDRRDLNRSFPGSASGSLASRMAKTIFDAIVSRCDFGIDLHTAAVRRTNYPNVRADLGDPAVSRLAHAFGAEIIIHGKGPAGSFRREACKAGCPTIIMEGGEVWKVEPGIVQTAVRGIKNVLCELNMLAGPPQMPAVSIEVRKSKWIRAERGGFLQFHVKPGEVVAKGDALATNTTLLGEHNGSLQSPFDAVVLGMTTLPAVSPGEPVCHLGQVPKSMTLSTVRRKISKHDTLEEQVSEELASSLMVVEPEEP